MTTPNIKLSAPGSPGGEAPTAGPDDRGELLAEVRWFANEVHECALSLRDEVAIGPASNLNEVAKLLSGLAGMAARLDAGCDAAIGRPAPYHDVPDVAARRDEEAGPWLGRVEQVARDMAARGADRTEVEDHLRRYYDRAEARRLARRILRAAGPRGHVTGEAR